VPREAPNPNHAPTLNRQDFKGYIFSDDIVKESVEGYVQELRDKFDMPFDELFHKEKRLVDAVVKATEALRRKEATLPNPMGADRTFSTTELKNEYYAKELQTEHQFSIDQRHKSKALIGIDFAGEKLMKEGIDEAGTTDYTFALQNTKSKVQEMLDQGIITQREYD